MSHFRVQRIGKDPRRLDGCVGVADGAFRVLAQEPSHKADAFFPDSTIFPKEASTIVGEHCAIAAEDDF